MTTTDKVSQKLQDKAVKTEEKALAKVDPSTLPPEKQIEFYVKQKYNIIKKALPKHISPERIARICVTTIQNNEKLLKCSIDSLMAAVVQAAQLGLEPSILGECYFVPFWDSKLNKGKGGYNIVFIIGYRGMINLARRSGDIKSISVHEVYSNDFLEVEFGIDEKLKHIPWHLRTDDYPDEAGYLRGAYMVARFKDGGYYVHYMPKKEIDDHKKRSNSKNRDGETVGPWVTDYIEMAKKTVIRSAWKWLPISVEIASKFESVDGTTLQLPEQAPENSDIIDVIPTRIEYIDNTTDDKPPVYEGEVLTNDLKLQG